MGEWLEVVDLVGEKFIFELCDYENFMLVFWGDVTFAGGLPSGGKVENPKNVDVIKGDKVDVDLGGRTISVSRGNNPAPRVKMMFQVSCRHRPFGFAVSSWARIVG